MVGRFAEVRQSFNSSGADRAPKPSIKRKTTMKKTLVLAIILGFAAVLNVSAADAKANWESLCAKCHGAEGKGDTKIGQKLGVKDFTDAKVQADLKDDVAAKNIKEGLKDADGKTLMKPFDTLSDDEVKALVQYVRSLKK
jgi:mono/diheme cytochrome c family protein